MNPAQLIYYYETCGISFNSSCDYKLSDLSALIRICELKLHAKCFSLKKTMDAQMDYLTETYKTKQ